MILDDINLLISKMDVNDIQDSEIKWIRYVKNLKDGIKSWLTMNDLDMAMSKKRFF